MPHPFHRQRLLALIEDHGSRCLKLFEIKEHKYNRIAAGLDLATAWSLTAVSPRLQVVLLGVYKL